MEPLEKHAVELAFVEEVGRRFSVLVAGVDTDDAEAPFRFSRGLRNVRTAYRLALQAIESIEEP